MAKVLVTYYTRTGHTRALAESVRDGAAAVSKAKVDLKPLDQVAPDDLLDYDAIIMGSPVYYGSMAAELKKLIDDTVQFHGRLEGKIGGAFATSANLAGGNETTILDIINAMLIHGMIIPGSSQGDHYGPVAINAPDARAVGEGRKLGTIIAQLAVKLFG